MNKIFYYAIIIIVILVCVYHFAYESYNNVELFSNLNSQINQSTLQESINNKILEDININKKEERCNLSNDKKQIVEIVDKEKETVDEKI